MDQTEIIEKIKALQLNPAEYLVISGSAMAAFGLRPAGDVDMVASKKLFAKLKKERDWQYLQRPSDGTEFLKGENVDVASRLDGKDYATTLAEAKAREHRIEGVPFMAPEDLLQFKQALGRKKDKTDVSLLRNYLKND